MPLDRLVDGGSFAPEALQIIYKAFDLAWSDLAPRYGNDLAQIEYARSALAQAVLSAAGTDPKDAHALKTSALALFEQRMRDRD